MALAATSLGTKLKSITITEADNGWVVNIAVEWHTSRLGWIDRSNRYVFYTLERALDFINEQIGDSHPVKPELPEPPEIEERGEGEQPSEPTIPGIEVRREGVMTLREWVLSWWRGKPRDHWTLSPKDKPRPPAPPAPPRKRKPL